MESLPEGWNICRECLGAVLNDITLYITISRFISPRQATGVSRRLPRSCTEVTGYKQTKFSSCYWFYQLTNLNINIISLHTFHSLHTGSANCPQPRTIKVFRNLLSLGKGEGMGGGEVQKLSAACKFFRISCLVLISYTSTCKIIFFKQNIVSIMTLMMTSAQVVETSVNVKTLLWH